GPRRARALAGSDRGRHASSSSQGRAGSPPPRGPLPCRAGPGAPERSARSSRGCVRIARAERSPCAPMSVTFEVEPINDLIAKQTKWRRSPQMPSPFPGIDPYLEARGLWEGFQHSLVSHCSDTLNYLLPEGYVAKLEGRLRLVLLTAREAKQI